MSKYGCTTTSGACRAELEEIRKILEGCKVDAIASRTILAAVKAVYYELNTAYASGRAMERMIAGYDPDWMVDGGFQKFFRLLMEEEQKYPFVVSTAGEDEDDD